MTERKRHPIESIVVKTFNGFIWVLNVATLGGVTHMSQRRRVPHSQKEGPYVHTADTYAEGETVSLESAADQVLKLQEALDQHVPEENLGYESELDRRSGGRPCQKARRQG